MAGYNELKNAIERVVKTNNNREITGQNLQNTLTSMVNSLGANYHFAGFASPNTNPGTPDQNIFYIASEEGTYINFDRIILKSGLSFLMWNGQWSSKTISIGEVTKSWVQQNYVSIAFFNELFELYNDNTKIVVNGDIPVDKSKLNIKAMFGFWTERYISALGLNDSGSGGGGIDMTVVWSALAENTNEQINKSHLTTALSGYATASWVSQNFATLASIPTKVSQLINDEGFITSAALPTKVSQLSNDAGYITSAALPTRVSQLSNDAGYITSSPLSNYLPLSGGTMTGTLVVLAGSSKFGPSLDDDTYKYHHAVYLGTHGVDHADFYETTFNFWGNGGFGTPNVYIGGNTVYHAGNLKNVSQLSNDAGYVTASIVDGYATQNWVNQNFITTSFFDELFQLYTNTTKISPNGTIPADKTSLNIKAMFGFWTERYLSALGLNDNGSSSSVGVLNDLLDVSISNPSNGQALVYNGNAWVNGNAGVDMNTVWGYLASTTSEQINKSHLTTALSGYALTSQLSNYLPLSGGTMTGNISWATDSHGIYFCGGCGIEKWSGYGPSLVGEGPAEFAISSSSNRAVRYLILHSGNWSSYVGTSSAPVGYASNASYATSAGFAETSNYVRYVKCPDTRTIMPAPSEYTALTTGVAFDFKSAEVVGLSGYTGVMTFRPYGGRSDWSGGAVHQLGFCANDRLYHRVGTSSWWSWSKIAYTSDIPSALSSFSNDVGYITSSGSCSYASRAGDSDTVDNLHASDLVQIAGTQTITGSKTFYSVSLNCNTPHYLRTGVLTGGFFYGTASNEALAIGLQNGSTSFMVVTGTDISTWSSGTWMSASPDIQVKQKSLYVNSLIADDISPSYNFYVNGTTCLGGTSSYYQYPNRGGNEGGAHHILYGSDCDYGVVKIRHTSDQGSGGPGDFSASLGIFDERANSIGGAFQPTFYINRTGATRVPDIMGCDVGGTRIFTIQSGGNVGIGTSSPSTKLDVNGSAKISGTLTVATNISATGSVTAGGGLVAIQGLAVGANSNLSGNLTVLGTTSLNGTVSIGGDLSGTNHITGFTGIELNSTGALSDYGGYIDFHYNGSTSDYTSRIIEDASGRLYINNSLCVFNGGNTGIGTISPSYKLHVEGVIYSSTGIFSNGYVSALGQNTSSDIRLKDIKSDVALSIDSIANAPSVRYEWKNDSSLGMQVGSIAQYWQTIMPEAVHKDNKGYLSMEYGVISLLASISTARKVQDHERRIAQLEKENERLRTELEQIKAA